MKNKITLSLAIVAVAFGTYAENPRAKRIVRAGGEIVKKGSYLGKVSIVNQQSKLSAEDCAEVAKLLAEHTQCNIVSDDGNEAAIKLYLIDDPKGPTMLLATEDHWGKLNLSKMVDDLPGEKAKEKFFVPRARKMIIKAMSLLMGGGSSQFPGNIMNTATIRELDMLKENIPVDMIDYYQTYLAKLGVTKMEKTTYLRACKEGWAPTPTNDVQKAIWDKVHAMPTAPIKIKPETKKVRE